MSQAPLRYTHYLAEIRGSFPEAFSHLAWLAFEAFSAPALPATRAGGVLAPLALEHLATRRAIPRGQVEQADVLLYFQPARVDYLALFVPVVEELLRRGIGVMVVTPPGSSLSAADFGSAATMPLRAFQTVEGYASARLAYWRLAKHLRRFVKRFGTHERFSTALSLLLQNYCWHAELFRSALWQVRPKVVLGLHFMSDPGPLGAIARHRQQVAPLNVLLLQHGVFSHTWTTHDFHGADLVLLWSEESVRQLRLFPGETPSAEIVGNPKMAWHIERGRNGSVGRGDGGAPRILVVGTNGDARIEQELMQMAARALGRMPGIDVIFRPHPSEPLAKYRAMVEDGLLSAAQIQSQGSVYDAVADSTVVVGTQSTLLPESAMLGTPVVQLVSPERSVFWEGTGMVSASSEEELSWVASELVTDPVRRMTVLARESRVACDLLGEHVGAAQRTVDAISRLLA